MVTNGPYSQVCNGNSSVESVCLMLPLCAVERAKEMEDVGLTVAPQVAFGTLWECDYCSERLSQEVTVGISYLWTPVLSFYHMGSGVQKLRLTGFAPNMLPTVPPQWPG